MKQFFLMLSFAALTIIPSDRKGNQVLNYDKSNFKNGFFGGTGFFLIKQNVLNSFNKDSMIQTKKSKDVVPLNIAGEKLDPMDSDSKVRMHYGFNTIIETNRKYFLEELLKKFGIKEDVTCFYSLEEDQHHVSWHIKGRDVGSIPIIMEHCHEGRCCKSKAEEYMK